MKQKGRKSTAELSVIKSDVRQRLPAPDCLLPEEREAWDRITATKAADFFDDGNAQLLVEFCRLTTSLELVAGQIEEFNPEWFLSDDGLKRYKTLSDIRDKEQGRMNALARALRLTNQSRFQPSTAATRSSKTGDKPKPWQRES